MDLGVDGRVALVMGASKGIGRGIAGALAREGAKVAMVSRSEDALQAAASEVGAEAIGVAADTGDLERMSSLVDEVAERLGGPVEILVVNTGGPPLGGALDNPPEDWEGAHRSLLLAPQALIAAALPAMRERGFGRIVNVASSSVREPIPSLNLSNTYRLAAAGFFKTLAREVAGDGITVNTIATGRFATDRLASNWGGWEEMQAGAARDVPAGRLGEPEEYGDLVAFVCSERAGYLTGAIIPLDGGLLRSV